MEIAAALSEIDSRELEYTASDIRRILQQLFPHRRLVLSQFTFFNQIGVAKPTGESFKRGRRCYKLSDILSIACVLALKEEGIPLKNIDQVPAIVQQNSVAILEHGPGMRLNGHGEHVVLLRPDEIAQNSALDSFLNDIAEGCQKIFWSYDVGLLATQIRECARGGKLEVLQAA